MHVCEKDQQFVQFFSLIFLFFPVKLLSTSFEQIIAHHQEVISVHAAYRNHIVLAVRHPIDACCVYRNNFLMIKLYAGVLISPQPDQEGNMLQRLNSGFTQHTPHEAQYTYQPVALTFASHSIKFRSLSVQPGLRGKNDLRVRRKMAKFQLFFFSVQGTGRSRICSKHVEDS